MSKKSFIDSVRVASPCTQDWDEMHGNEQVRFCSHCAKEVNNLSTMTRKEARRLVRKSDGRLCIRYIKNPETNGPLFSEQLIQISRRAPLMAAGVMTATLSLSTLTFAQGGSRPSALTPPITLLESPVSDTNTTSATSASVSGSVVDPNGAVIPNTSIILTNDKASETKTVMSNDQGGYRFENVSPGSYVIQAEVVGFSSHTASLIVTAGNEITMDIALGVGIVEVSVDVFSDVDTQSFVSGGIGFTEYATPLHRAVADDNIEQVRELIARGEDVNGKEKDNTTPLFIAVENGNLEIVEILLNFGAKVNARNEEKRTPLMMLDDDASGELVQLLLKHGAKVNLTDEDGNSALILAAREVEPEVLKVLIDARADINARNEEGQTALMNAADDDNLESVRLLILAGADVNAKNKEGETAWALTGDDEIAELLVTNGAIVEETSDEEPEDN